MGSGASKASSGSTPSSTGGKPGRQPGTYYTDPFNGDVYIFKDPDAPKNKEIKDKDTGKTESDKDSSEKQNDKQNEAEQKEEDVEEEKTLPWPKPPKKLRAEIFNEEKYKKIDEYVRNLGPEAAANDYDSLVQKLLSQCSKQDEIGRVRALFAWLTSQDVYNMEVDDLPPRNSPLDHLLQIRFGTNARATHSYIMYQLCKSAKMPSVFIRGVNKSAAYEVGEPIDKRAMTSSWNAVYAAGDWRLVDAFWASTCLVGQKSDDWKLLEADGNQENDDNDEAKATHYMNEFFFMADPQRLCFTHLPDDPHWQLQDTPTVLAEFEKSVYVRERYHQLGVGFRDTSSRTCLVTVPGGEHKLDFALPQNRSKNQVFQYFFFKQGREGVDLDRYVMYEKREDLLRYSIRFPITGKYKIQIFGNETPLFNEDDIQLVCTYVFNATKVQSGVKPLPDSPEIGWGQGAESEKVGLTPITHQEGLIESQDGIVEIRLKSAKELDMLHNVLTDESQSHLTGQCCVTRKEGDEYVVSMRLPEAGEYALMLHADPSAKRDKDLSNVCNYLVKVMKGNANAKPFPKIRDGMLGMRPEGAASGAKTAVSNSGLIRLDDGKYQLKVKKGSGQDLMCELTNNELNSAVLEKCVKKSEQGEYVVFDVDLPKADEYGLNVYGTKKGSGLAENVHNCLLISSQSTTNEEALAVTSDIEVKKQKITAHNGKAVVRVPKLANRAVATVQRKLQAKTGAKVTVERQGEEDVFTVQLPELGHYDLEIYDEKAGVMTKHYEFHVEHTDEPEPEPEPEPEMSEEEKARLRKKEELIARMRQAMEAEDASLLAAAIKEFHSAKLDDDKGRVQKAQEFLDYLRIRDKLSAAMANKDLEKLEVAIDEAESNNKIAQKLGIQLAMAKRTRDSLRRIAKLRHAILNLDQKTIAELKSYATPPDIVFSVMKATFLLLGNKPKEMKDWNQTKILMNKTGKEGLKRRVGEFNVDNLDTELADKAKKHLTFDLDAVRDVSAGAAAFYVWADGMIAEVESR